MTLPDVLLMAAVLAAAAAAVRSMARRRGKGCCGHCAGCRNRCGHGKK